MAIRILTDSTADLSPREARRLGVSVIPLKVQFGERSYRDGIDLDSREFYEMLGRCDELPTTSQPSTTDFLTCFEDARYHGDSVVCLLISSALSGTVQSATAAKSLLGYDDIHIVDTKSVIIGLRLLVLQALRMKEQGKSAAEIAAGCEAMKRRLEVFGVVDTLEYLHRGGRISGAVRLVGGMLNIKPILQLQDGRIEMVSKARGSERSMSALLQLIGTLPPVDGDVPFCFGYSADARLGSAFEKLACERLRVSSAGLFPIGSVVGTHVGPGAFAVAFLKRDASDG